MAAYVATNLNVTGGSQQSLTSAFKTLIGITAATGATTLRRGWIMEWEIGATDVPSATDCPILWDISKSTSTGTGTTMVPTLNDMGGGDAAALLLYKVNCTVEPTIAVDTSVWFMALNQRASYRVQMRDEWSAIIVPAVNITGPAMRAKSPNYASTAGWRALVRE